MMRHGLARLERRPWTLAVIAAAGITLLLPSGAALLLPPDLLDRAVALGDWRLELSLLGLFAISACLARLALRRRARAEEELEDAVSAGPPAVGSHRPAPLVEREDLAAGPARGYLR